MRKKAQARNWRICLLSPHPLVLGEFQRVLSKPGFHVVSRLLEPTLAPDFRNQSLPKAVVYVVDAHTARPAAISLIRHILEQNPAARVLVVAEKFTDSNSYSFLRLGVRGLLTYVEATQQLPRAVPPVATGGYWVPRAILAGFVDSILNNTRGRRLRATTNTELSPREREVMDALLENLSNKEIASKLNISERTAKFHVSNLLSKFGVRRRADLILLCYNPRPAA